ncbi:hypothetical protein PTKIN_Ptkin08bG0203200 [Pterospermum kingtungense]
MALKHKPFWDFFSVAKARPKEDNVVSEKKDNVSLELSLSCDQSSNAATDKGKGEENLEAEESKYSCGQYQGKLYNVMESFGGGSVSSEPAGFLMKLFGYSLMSKTKSSESDEGNHKSTFEVGNCSYQYQREHSDDVCLELSLSSGYNRDSKTKSPEANQRYPKRSFEVDECSYQYQEEHGDVYNLELSLSSGYSRDSKTKTPEADRRNPKRSWSFEVGECSHQHSASSGDLSVELKLGYDDACNYSKKRERMGIPCVARKASSRRNKRMKAGNDEEITAVSTELVGIGPDPWLIKKQLLQSDLGHLSRLMLSLEGLKDYVFPFWDVDKLARITEGVPVSVWDSDTSTEHQLVFRQWNKGANVLKQNWTREFVKRRSLNIGDTIGLFWDSYHSRFNFSVLNRAPGINVWDHCQFCIF